MTIAKPGGTTPNNAGWATEISLDVEWAHAVAPQANILLVEASSASTSALLQAVGYAATHASVVSMSWGTSEFSGETAYDTGSGGVAGFNGFANYPGVTFVAARPAATPASSGRPCRPTSWPWAARP